MRRLIGAALVTAGCAALGLGGAARLGGRVRDLGELAAGLDVLRRELGWRLAPLPEALELAARCVRGPAAAFFAQCAGGAGRLEGRAFQQVWQEGLEDGALRLREGDRAALARLGPVLGRYDSDSQLQALDRTAAGLRRLQEEAEDDRRRLGRVYAVLGVTAGLLAAITLL
ncbi:MAG: stage III sporulation protein AB [Oscillospiraceae bacterium]|nr:stage III sporulation protein AB [Oscillospiraceae bacterium]